MPWNGGPKGLSTGLFAFPSPHPARLKACSQAKLTYLISSLTFATLTRHKYLSLTSNHHTTHYLDLTLSLNHFTIKSHRVHHQIYQKPHHKYMYPHFSSNHPHHIFAGIIKTETIRYSRLSATIDDYNFIHHLFTLRLSALDYPLQLITEHSFPWITRTAHQ